MNITAYAYRMKWRPIQMGAQPKGFLIVPGTSNTTREGGDYGRIFYKEKLPDDDVKAFELTIDGSVILEPVTVYSGDKVYEWKIVEPKQEEKRRRGRPFYKNPADVKSTRLPNRVTPEECKWLQEQLYERRQLQAKAKEAR